MAKKSVKANPVKKDSGKSFFEKYRFELIVFVFSVILFANSIPHDYNMDDELVTINHRLTSRGISAIPEIFTTTYYRDNMGYAYEYRPMVLASFAVEHQIFGDSAPVSHFFNVLLYGICCVVLYRTLLWVTLGFSTLIPLGITLLFVAHPAHTEVVCSIKNRDEILALLFSLLTLIAAFKAVGKGMFWWLAVPLLFVAALMSKLSVLPFTIIIPLAIILFTEAGFKKVMAISFLLALSSFFVINNVLLEKIATVAGMVTVSLIIFVSLRFKQCLAWVKSVLHSILSKPEQLTGEPSGEFTPGSLKNFFSGISYDYTSYLFFWPIVISLAVTSIYWIGVITVFPLLLVIAAIAFFVLLMFANDKTAWWGNIFLYASLALTLIKYPLGAHIFTDLLTICLAYQILYGDRRLFIPSVIIFSSLFFLEPINTIGGDGVVALLAFRWKWTWPVMLLALGVGLNSSIHDFLTNEPTHHLDFHLHQMTLRSDNYGVFIALFLIISILARRGTKTFVSGFQAFAIATLIITHVFFSPPLTPSIAGHDLKEQIGKLGEKVNTNIIADKIDRPLVFVEQPVNSKSPLTLRAGTAFEILFIYLHKVIIPYPMSFYYGYRFIEPEKLTDVVPLVSLVLYTTLMFLAMYFLKRQKLTGFGLMIYLVSIASVSSFFFPIPGQLGERFLFIPSLGWSIVFVLALYSLYKEKIPGGEIAVSGLPGGFKYAFAGLLCFYTIITFSRNFDWKDYTTLTRHDIDYVQNSAQANNLMALNLMKKSYEIQDPLLQRTSREEALGHFKKSLEIYPDFYNVTYDIARVFNVLNENDSAVVYFKRALAIDSANSDPALFAGQILEQQGKFAEAIPLLKYAMVHNPSDYQPFDKLSYAYFKIGDFASSIAVNKIAITKLPPQTAPYANIARVFIAQNQTDSAHIYLQKATAINGNDQLVQQLIHSIEGK